MTLQLYRPPEKTPSEIADEMLRLEMRISRAERLWMERFQTHGDIDFFTEIFRQRVERLSKQWHGLWEACDAPLSVERGKSG